MNDLLAQVIDTHGGIDHWNGFEKVEATVSGGGGFFAFKGIVGASNPIRVTVWLHQQRVTLAPFGAADQHASFTPERVAVEKSDGTVIAERAAPRDAFAGHQMSTQWDPLHLAYFAGEAYSTYFKTPFLLAEDGVQVEETEPWQEGAETWRVLRATFPGSIETHSPVQDFFFGDDLMLRRHDYQVDVSGGFGAAQLTSNPITADGIRLPSRRLAYTRGPDRRPILDMLMVSMDIADVRFT
jgi:hypothetical protein